VKKSHPQLYVSAEKFAAIRINCALFVGIYADAEFSWRCEVERTTWENLRDLTVCEKEASRSEVHGDDTVQGI
jgi:hypothetical protein